MYRLGENHIKRRHRHMAAGMLGILILLAGTIWAVRSFRTGTVIAPSPPSTTSRVTVPKVPTKQIDEPLFVLDLPTDWKLKDHNTASGNNIYTWVNTAGNTGVRSLALYLDTPAPSLGVNRALSVQGNNDKLAITSDVSDNCASFTGPGAGAPTDAAAAKWNGVNFLCDLANYERDVVGTVSTDGINKAVLTGSVSGTHSVFLAYTDSSSQPDYNIFLNALQSFHLK